MNKHTQIKLTEFAKSAGCAAKLGQADLKDALSWLPKGLDKNLLVGHGSSDDAAVYRLSDNLALVETVDIFPPVVDDPYDYGRIAAANALSDIYAMGANPISALSFVAWPVDKLGTDTLRAVISGASDVCEEAGIVIGGGHSISDEEPKFGLFVNGTVHPNEIKANDRAKLGDALILTKKIGTGIVTSAAKKGYINQCEMKEVVSSMTTLNDTASKVMCASDVQCATDVTGFGLLGHLGNMLSASSELSTIKLGANINFEAVPFFELAVRFINQGSCPAGTKRNLEFIRDKLNYDRKMTEAEKLLIADAQTSGGLLLSVPQEKCLDLVTELREVGLKSSRIIGEIVESEEVGSIKIL